MFSNNQQRVGSAYVLRWTSHMNANCDLRDCDAGDAFWNIRTPRTDLYYYFFVYLTTSPKLCLLLKGKYVE